jgi:hypothetical protein
MPGCASRSRPENGLQNRLFCRMVMIYTATMHERHDQQLVNLPVLSLIIYAKPSFAETIGSRSLAPKQLKSLP